jgi:hypothetical protein
MHRTGEDASFEIALTGECNYFLWFRYTGSGETAGRCFELFEAVVTAEEVGRAFV